MTDRDELIFLRDHINAHLGAVQPPVDPPVTQPPIQPPTQPPAGSDGVFLGDFSAQGGPGENGVPNMAADVTYSRRQFIGGMGGGSMQFQSGYLTGYSLPNFESWISNAPGGSPLPFSGCEREELQGSNVAARIVSLAQLTGAGVLEVFFCLRAKGPTGRYMQRT